MKLPSDKKLYALPSVDEVLRSPECVPIASEIGERATIDRIQKAVASVRKELVSKPEQALDRSHLKQLILDKVAADHRIEMDRRIRRVINATGVVIHTNLGRAPLSTAARDAVVSASGYVTLEYDTATGKRAKRGHAAESLLAEMTGAESVLIVNNCAAAAFFVLSCFASGGEVLLSRGEMVEIGGDFRVPDVLSQSGATLREVGTTNRTRTADYERAVNDRTRMILRVHPSNYRIVGFTASPSLRELADLAQKKKLILYEDLGSGALIDLAEAGLRDEPIAYGSIKDGADIVTFSGDKLLGGPQAGIIAGKSRYVDKLRKHPLNRALRVDKLTLAALEATLVPFRRGNALTEIPVLKMLSMTKAVLEERAERLAARLRAVPGLSVDTIDGESAIGGGAAPTVVRETKLVTLVHSHLSAKAFETKLRQGEIPVIARIADDRVVIDPRTVLDSDEEEFVSAVSRCAGQNPA